MDGCRGFFVQKIASRPYTSGWRNRRKTERVAFWLARKIDLELSFIYRGLFGRAGTAEAPRGKLYGTFSFATNFILIAGGSRAELTL